MIGVFIFLIVSISTVEMKAASKKTDHMYCEELGRAVEDICSYGVARRKCPKMCKGDSPKLECGKNLHTRKSWGLLTDGAQYLLEGARSITEKTRKYAEEFKDWFGKAWDGLWNSGREGKKKGNKNGSKRRIHGEKGSSKRVFNGEKQGSKRVVNGEKSEQGEWPWHLTIRNYPNKNSKYPGARWCDATILTENFALTAWHCFDEYIEGIVGHKNFSAEHMKVVAGDYNTEKKEEFESEIQVAEIYLHPSYKYVQYSGNGRWSVDKHDVALMRLETPIKLEDKNKEQVCIPKSGSYDDWRGATCFSYGYGFTEKGILPDYLREVKLPLVSLDECNKPQAYNNTVTSSHWCAGYFDIGKTVCQFDSGASLVCKKSGDDPRWFQVGVVSAGKTWNLNFTTLFEGKAQKDVPCSMTDGDYGLFANVVKNIEWILKTILEVE